MRHKTVVYHPCINNAQAGGRYVPRLCIINAQKGGDVSQTSPHPYVHFGRARRARPKCTGGGVRRSGDVAPPFCALIVHNRGVVRTPRVAWRDIPYIIITIKIALLYSTMPRPPDITSRTLMGMSELLECSSLKQIKAAVTVVSWTKSLQTIYVCNSTGNQLNLLNSIQFHEFQGGP